MERLTHYNGYYNEYDLSDKIYEQETVLFTVLQRLGQFEQLCEEYNVKDFDELVEIVRKAKGE